VTTSPFPDSRPLADLLAGPMEVTFPPVPEGPSGWQMTLSDVVMLVRMPDGVCAWGRGATNGEAEADARRNWLRWKRAHTAPLAVDGHEYRRRCKARARRHR
jgi:hypothetical protein